MVQVYRSRVCASGGGLSSLGCRMQVEECSVYSSKFIVLGFRVHEFTPVHDRL
jgi:hypothetical protein